MSMRYKGAVISATPPTTSSTTATGVWTLPQQMQAQGAGNWPYGGPFTYIEDVFSTYLYTGNGNGSGTTGTVATITNNINLSTNGGLVWIKNRGRATNHGLYDTSRGALNGLQSNGTGAQSAFTNTLTAFTTSGFSLGNDSSNTVNLSGDTYASWTFRKQPKFFDVVTWTSTASSNASISHQLGSAPGFIVARIVNDVSNWVVYHKDLGINFALLLNTTNAQLSITGCWGNTAPTSTTFNINEAQFSLSNVPMVAYLFASNAGGFGLTGTDNVITCGSFTTDGSGTATVTLGYEPQWIIIKATAGTESWQMYDTMRGWSVKTSGAQELDANSASVEAANNAGWPTATGFFTQGQSASRTYIYIAIRRGPMKVPTVGTSVFTPATYTGTNATRISTAAGFPIDSILSFSRSAGTSGGFFDRLRGATRYLETPTTAAESSGANSLTDFASMTGYTAGADTTTAFINYSGTYVNWMFRRAPGFFDEVCYTGTGTALSVTHNLQAVPELIIWKCRSNAIGWYVYNATTGVSKYLVLNNSSAAGNFSLVNNIAPTSTTFNTTTSDGSNNQVGYTYVAYLFASCPGVSKVGSYTGTGATQTIDCGFTGGARFVLIKRTDSTGDWYVWDTARGMVSGTDPSSLLNSPAAEVNANSVYTTGVGFQIVSTAAGINASGGTYIFLSVA